MTATDDTAKDRSAGQHKRKRILIVDDERDITTIIKRGLERKGFEVDVFNDPLAALDGLKKLDRYDLALLDINMPNMNGFQLFRELRSRDSNLRVCFITAFEIYYDEFKRVFPKIKVSCFVRKPVTISALADTIRREIESGKSEENPELVEAKLQKAGSEDQTQLAAVTTHASSDMAI